MCIAQTTLVSGEYARSAARLAAPTSQELAVSRSSPRVGIIALLQESNTFIRQRTTLAYFEQDLLLEGEAVRDRLAASHHEIGGFFGGLVAAGIEAVPVFVARAVPFGMMTADTLDALLKRMMAALDRAGRLDGVLVAPHGANVAENIADVDGHWLSLLRHRLGAQIPIIGTLDLHANLSPAMVSACDALIGYRTNPHLDQHARGLEAAALMARTLRGEVRPTMAAAYPPMVINIAAQATAEPPCKGLYALADQMLQTPGVLSNTLLLGFPYADVPEMGPAAIVVTDNDPAAAQRQADELAAQWLGRREAFEPKLIGVEEAIDQAAKLEGPVCLLDMGDNVGGGSPGDGTVLTRALHARRMSAFVCLADAESVAAATTAGVGAHLRLRLGGKADPQRHGDPLELDVTVRGLTIGRFDEPSPRHGGITTFDQGPTAVVDCDSGLTLMLTTRRMPPFSLRQLTANGVDPAAFHVLVAKGVHAPVAAYAPVCRHLIRVDTPGVTCADLTQFEYRLARRVPGMQ
jgi:microcystin degradation protein MlrC